MSAVTSESRHLTASMVVIDPASGRVLLVHHNASGLWLFPGGHVDPGETPAEAAVREVFEETGVEATVAGIRVDLPGMAWHPSPWMTAAIPAPAKPARGGKPAEPAHTHIDLLFVGTADGAAGVSMCLDEVSSVAWVPVSDVGSLAVRAEVPWVARAALGFLRSFTVSPGV